MSKLKRFQLHKSVKKTLNKNIIVYLPVKITSSNILDDAT